MYPDSALSAGPLAIMAVVAVVSMAAWLILVFLAARQPRGTSAAAAETMIASYGAPSA